MPEFAWVLAAAALIALEAGVGWWSRRPLYGLLDSEIGLALTIGWAVGAIATAGLSLACVTFCYQHRVLTLPNSLLTAALAILIGDFIYYWWHWASHHLGWLWATHFVHHTAPRMNVLASLRQSWTDIISGTWLVWAPMGFLGFSPQMVAVYFTTLLIWEGATHNEWTPRLGWLEWILVTPSNHRVHHSRQERHWNRNYGGLLILWDRLFGTYIGEGAEPIRSFGLAGIDDTAGPVEIVLRGWRSVSSYGWNPSTQAPPAAAQQPD